MMGRTPENTPLVNIVMATYNPRLDWFEEQLQSLNNQNYRNIKILVMDDCSTDVEMQVIKDYIDKNITNFPYEVYQNETNLGSNKTFEKLTQMADGEYIAYCDQDDVWLPEKIEVYLSEIKSQDALLICSDMYIIDSQGRQKADSITKVRRHHIFKSGDGLAEQLIFSNFVTGCAMMIQSDIAKKAVPFCPFMVHDHYLALYSANQGKIGFIDKPLINYRIHEGNQTSMMAGVTDKKSYVIVRIELALQKMYWLKTNFTCSNNLMQTIDQGIEWLVARKDNMEGVGRAKKIIWKYRHFSNLTSIFEIMAPFIPNRIFMVFINMKRRNII